jgi:PAS domain S-box-containing protein
MTGETTRSTVLLRAAVTVVAVLCAIATVGWFFGAPVLTSFAPGWAQMSLPSIVCFLLSGASIVALALPMGSTRPATVLRVIALVLVAAIGVYVLADFIVRGGLRGSALSAGSGYVFGAGLGRVSPATAFNFLILAVALLLPREQRMGRIHGGLVAAGLTVCALALAGYAYGVEALYRVLPFSAMALPTAICFTLLFVCALLANPNDSWAAAILSNDSAGGTARRLLPAIVVVPFALAGAVVAGNRSGLFDAAFGFALLAVATALGLACVTVAMAARIGARDVEQSRSQRLTEAIIENTPAVIYAKDLAGRYLMINQRFADIFHVDRATMIGKTDRDLFSKDAADAFRAMDERVARMDRPLTEEETAPQDDGPHTYISVKSPLRDDLGRPYAVYGISTDVTDQRRIEAALLASEQRNRLIVESAMDAIVTIDSAGVITGWSPQAETTFGWTHAEALGRPVDQTIMPERFREAHRAGLARYLATGEAHVLNKRIELTALHRNGAEFPIELSITPVREGDTVSFNAFARDITERKLAEARLHTQRDRLHLLEQITRAIGQRQDVQSIFQVAVRALEDRLPADFVCILSHDAVSRTLTVAHVGAGSAALGRELDISDRAEIPIDRNGLSRCVGGELVYEPDLAEVDFPFPRRLVAHGLRSLVIAPLAIESDVFGVLVVARSPAQAFQSTDCEFTKQLGEHVALAAHQTELREKLQKAYDDLRQTQQAVLEQERLRAIGQMASGIAHDINNAISPVALYTQSLIEHETDLPPDIRDYLALVGRVVRDVAATVGRMRDFYRSGRDDPELTPLDLNELVPQVIELTRARWSDMPQQRGTVIKVSTELEANLPQVMGNASELREALTNLIFNAVDAMPKGGSLAVRTLTLPRDASGAPRVRLEVGDTGAGMDEATRRRCVEPFFTTKGERGTGLGLAMVQGAAQRHKAELDIDSAPGEGTRVRLDFDTVSDARRKRKRTGSAAAIEPLRLLLVDDDPTVLGSTAFVLELDGHDITAADGGQAGIEALRAAREAGTRFDLVITDLGMPYVDGNQVAGAVKELFPSTPVVLLTGWGRRMATGDEAPAHVDYVLPKPLELGQLRDVFVELTRASQS